MAGGGLCATGNECRGVGITGVRQTFLQTSGPLLDAAANRLELHFGRQVTHRTYRVKDFQAPNADLAQLVACALALTFEPCPQLRRGGRARSSMSRHERVARRRWAESGGRPSGRVLGVIIAQFTEHLLQPGKLPVVVRLLLPEWVSGRVA